VCWPFPPPRLWLAAVSSRPVKRNGAFWLVLPYQATVTAWVWAKVTGLLWAKVTGLVWAWDEA
jgi:hypothetical protein